MHALLSVFSLLVDVEDVHDGNSVCYQFFRKLLVHDLVRLCPGRDLDKLVLKARDDSILLLYDQLESDAVVSVFIELKAELTEGFSAICVDLS